MTPALRSPLLAIGRRLPAAPGCAGHIDAGAVPAREHDGGIVTGIIVFAASVRGREDSGAG